MLGEKHPRPGTWKWSASSSSFAEMRSSFAETRSSAVRAPQAAFRVGYVEVPLGIAGNHRGIEGLTFASAWIPLKGSPEKLLSAYSTSICMSKKVEMMVSQIAKNGLPSCVPRCCFPTLDFSVPTSIQIGQLSPSSATDKSVYAHGSIRGLVVYAHGLSDGPISIAHVLERLAGHGFAVAAPSFSDDDSNDVQAVLAKGHSHLEEQHAERVLRMNACIDTLRKRCAGREGAVLRTAQLTRGTATHRYGSALPLALIGYSTGTDTIRHMPNECPRIYIAGPGWQNKVSGKPIATPTPGGPSLLLNAGEDAEMKRFGFNGDDAAAIAGPSPEARSTVRYSAVSEEAPKREHLRVNLEGFAHGSFKYPPFAASEDAAWRRCACGLDPFNPCSCGGGASKDADWQRCNRSADVIISWLLQVC